MQTVSRSRGTLAFDLFTGSGEPVAHLHEGVGHALAPKGRVPGQERVEQRTQAVDVRRGGDLAALAARLLGGHVGRSAQDGPAAGQLGGTGLEPLRQTKVGQVGLAVTGRAGCWTV